MPPLWRPERPMRYVYLAFFFTVAMVVAWAGFRGTQFSKPPIEIFPDMDRQPKYKPQAESRFFADGRTDRRPPANTVPRGIGYTSQAVTPTFDGSAEAIAVETGRNPDGTFLKGFPLRVTAELMARGKERYTIYCAPCHGALADGQGILSKYDWPAIANLHQERLVTGPEGDIFNTITNGKNTMYPYGDKLVPEDRWAVVLYVRALQRASAGSIEDIPAGSRKELGL